jgi:signal transduction histidine kinase
MKPITRLSRRRGLHHPRRVRPSPAASPSELNVARSLLELSSSTHGDWAGSLRHVIQFDAEALHVERVSFWSLDPERSRIRCDEGYVASLRSYESGAMLLRSDLPAYFDALLEARIIDVEDVWTDGRMQGLESYLRTRRIGAILDVPVWVEGRLAGVLCHEHVGSPRRWSASDQDFAMGAGQVVSSTLAARAQTQAEAAARHATCLDDVSQHALQSLDQREIASQVVQVVVPKLADASGIHVLEEGALECLASAAKPSLSRLVEEIQRALRANSQGNLLVARVFHEQQSLLVPDITPAVLDRYGVNEFHRGLVMRLGFRSAMAVPLAVAGRVFGAITFFAIERHYGTEDLKLATEIAERVAAALENARFYAMAREAIRARDELIVLASHELRTPLSSLQLLVEHKRRNPEHGRENQEAKRDEAIARQVRRLTALVERMLEAVRAQADGFALELEAFDLKTLVESAVEATRERATKAGSTLRTRVEPIAGVWDRARLTKVVEELLDNAIKFGAGRPIEVVLKREGLQAVLTVRDEGDGIPAERVSSLFTPFERAASIRNYGGLGLGLSLVKGIIQAHGGTVSVATRPAEGSTFEVRLPIDRGSEMTAQED